MTPAKDPDILPEVRRQLAHLVGLTPPAPPADRLVALAASERPAGGRRRRLALVTASLLAAVAAGAGTLAAVQRSDRLATDRAPVGDLAGFDADGDGAVDLALGQPVVLASMSDNDRTCISPAVTSVGLLSASTDGLSGPLQVKALLASGSTTDGDAGGLVTLPAPETRGILTAFEASGDDVVAVVSRHLDPLPPVVARSADGGRTWTSEELPAPEVPTGSGVDAAQAVVAPAEEPYAVAAAIGGDGVVAVAGGWGVWTSTGGGPWTYTPVASEGARLLGLVWNGTEFVAGGSMADPLIDPTAPATAGGDADLAFWRSPDGRTWTGPQVVTLDPDLRTSGGVCHLVAGPGGATLAFTLAQSWSRSMDLDGTVVALSSPGQPVAVRHLTEWVIECTIATGWGYLATGQATADSSTVRFLASRDGLTWHDLGPAPGLMTGGTFWRGGLVMEGYVSGGDAATWFFPPHGGDPVDLPPGATIQVPATVPAVPPGSSTTRAVAPVTEVTQ